VHTILGERKKIKRAHTERISSTEESMIVENVCTESSERDWNAPRMIDAIDVVSSTCSECTG